MKFCEMSEDVPICIGIYICIVYLKKVFVTKSHSVTCVLLNIC